MLKNQTGLKTTRLFFFLFCLSAANLSAQDPFPGTALEFDGVNDYINCGNPASLSFAGTAPFTIEMWVKPNVDNASGFLISKYNRGVAGEYRIGIGDGVPWFHREVAPWNIVGTTSLRADTWYHIAAVYNGDAMLLLVNGNAEATNLSGSISATSHNILIGAQHDNNVPGGFFNGVIEEVRIWNDARTGPEIAENMHLTMTGNESGLVAYWQFNEASGTSALDPVNGINGTLQNMDGADWIASGAPVGSGVSFGWHISRTGVHSFTGTGLAMDVTAFSGTNNITVTKLNRAPNTTPAYALADSFNSQYWIVNRTGNGSYSADMTFYPNKEITADDAQYPGSILLFMRPINSDHQWTASLDASVASVAGHSVTFENSAAVSQYYMGRKLLSVFTDRLGAGQIDWGDYDNDGDLDLLISADIYRNDNGVFNHIDAGLIPATPRITRWGDYDNDGDLDILLYKDTALKIYRNDLLSGFVDIGAGLSASNSGTSAWIDFDNDGDLDIVHAAANGIEIYRNDRLSFTSFKIGTSWRYAVSLDCGDYDIDGDLDLLITGALNSGPYGQPASFIYRNDLMSLPEPVFTEIAAGLENLEGSALWGDYDNDGDPDILITGNRQGNSIDPCSKIYRNDGPAESAGWIFTDINANLIDLTGPATWVDFDNDGDLDVMLSGLNNQVLSETALYRNNSDGFTRIDQNFNDMRIVSAAWADFDNDNDLDLCMCGSTETNDDETKIFRNNSVNKNSPPQSPSELSTIIFGDSVHFSWQKANDAETPQDGLSYNLVIGNSEYGLVMNPAMANTESGFRRIAKQGNAGQVTNRVYNKPDNYSLAQVIQPDYWGVQAIDPAYAGSPFSFAALDFPVTFLQLYNNDVMNLQNFLSWEVQAADSVTAFLVQVDDDSLFASPEINDSLFVNISGVQMYNVFLKDLKGAAALTEGTKYYWRIKPEYTLNLATIFSKPAGSFWFGFETGIEDLQKTGRPRTFALLQNYPNPFNPETTISYQLPSACQVDLSLYNMTGQKVSTLVSGQMPAGYHRVRWDAGRLASGVYVYKLVTDKGFRAARKLLLLK